MTDKRLFQGVVIPEAYYPALNLFAVSFNMVPEEVGDAKQIFVESVAEYYGKEVSEQTPRLWWHVTGKLPEAWISIFPGEYRNSCPEPPCEIREAPNGLPRVARRAILQEALETSNHLSPVSWFEETARARAVRLLARQGDGPVGDFHKELRSAQQVKQRTDYQLLVDRLYRTYLEELELPVSIFTDGVLLMQLQAMTNRWVEEDWAARPSAFLKPYISKMLDDSASAQGIMKVCELEYDDGREYVRRALAGSMQDMPRSLMLAWHRFLGAFRIADAVKKAKPNFTALPIDAIVVEEAAAWTITSVDLGVRFFLGHPDQEASDRIRNQNLFQTEVERVTRASSSETEPTFTRRFSEILTAQAMTQSNTRDLVERGVRDLLTLRAETDASTGDLEVAWVDHSLLKAYIQLDDRAAAESFATKIAAKIVVRTSIAR